MKIQTSYSKYTINDLRAINGTADIATLLCEGIIYDLTSEYLKLIKDNELILPKAPLITYEDFDLSSSFLGDKDSNKISINILKPLKPITFSSGLIRESYPNIDISLDEEGNTVLTNVFNGILLRTEDKEEFGICMRDSGFEFSYGGKWYEAKGGILKEMGK